ncbi:MAG: class I SAM-dependent methyltransferase [Dehalococcoidia bacterium]|nr:class I SAM-dependent methyltransferase [Dehalococcoidia bacterium]
MKQTDSEAAVWDAIAPAWYNVRHHTIFNTELTKLAERWKKGDLLNLGCGHGADFLPFIENFDLFGVDFSANMLEMARRFADKHDFQVKLSQADILTLPYPAASFEHAIAVASLHHIKGQVNRLQALLELRRVLKPGGEAFLTVWNRRQRRFWFKGREVMVPFTIDERTVQRYYYLFTYREIENLSKQAGFKIVDIAPESGYRFPIREFSRNICVLLKK